MLLNESTANALLSKTSMILQKKKYIFRIHVESQRTPNTQNSLEDEGGKTYSTRYQELALRQYGIGIRIANFSVEQRVQKIFMDV